MKKALILLPYANAHLGLFFPFIETHFEVTYYIHKNASYYRKYIRDNSIELTSSDLVTTIFKLRKGYFDVIFTHGVFYPFDLILQFTKNKNLIILSEMFRDGYNAGLKGLFKKWHLSRLAKNNTTSIFMFGNPIIEEQYKRLTTHPIHAFKYGMYPHVESAKNEKKTTTKPIRFVFAGQFIPRKNIRMLLDAILLTKAFETGEAEFIFIGEGPEKTQIETNTYASCLSTLSKPMLFSELNHADILVLVSAFEGWGAIVNEACACGCALLLSKNIGAAEVFMEENINGLYTEKDAQAISEKFEFFIANPYKLEAMKIASHSIFKTRYRDHDKKLSEIISAALSNNTANT